MPVQAIAKGIRMSHRKVGVVAALVRNHTVADALVILDNTPRRSAMPVRKVIESAKANAEYNHNYKPDTLRIVEISVRPGPSSRRYRPAARTRALPYLKRTAHIKVLVDGEKREPKKAAATAVSAVKAEEK